LYFRTSTGAAVFSILPILLNYSWLFIPPFLGMQERCQILKTVDNKCFSKFAGINFKWDRHFFMTVRGGGEPIKRRWEANNGTFRN
jgi:hypothetical protein